MIEHTSTCRRCVLTEDGIWWRRDDWLTAGSPEPAQHWHSARCETPEENALYALRLTGDKRYSVHIARLVRGLRGE